jgi:CBS domain-containing protein
MYPPARWYRKCVRKPSAGLDLEPKRGDQQAKRRCEFIAMDGLLNMSAKREFSMPGESKDVNTDVMTAADVMTVAPHTCSTFSTVLEAVMIFRDRDCGAVPILAEGKPVAILTDRDVALALGEFPDVASRPVSDIMTEGVVTVAPDDSLEHVCEVLRSQGVRRVLVVDSGEQLLGIIGWADMAPILSERMMGRLVQDVISPT